MSNFKYEVERLTKTVNELRGQLFESEADNQKLKLELECVLELLKKAWTGDRIASMHITNILNNAEISNLKQSNASTDPAVSRQAAMEKQQRDNLLRSRSEYLNQEFIKTVKQMGNMPVSCNTSQTMSRPSSSVLRRPTSTGGSRPGARALGAGRRVQSAHGERQVSHSSTSSFQASIQVQQPAERMELFGLRPASQSSHGTRYDDPSRYMKDGLFNTNSVDLKITGKPGSLQTVPFIYAQGLHPNMSPRVQASQAIAARRQAGRVNPGLNIPVNGSRRPPSGILAVQDRPLKNEVQYYEPPNSQTSSQSRRVQSSHPRDTESDDIAIRTRPKSSTVRGIRFAEDVEVAPRGAVSEQDAASEDPNSMPGEEKKRRQALAIQRRIGISDNAIVVPR